MPNYRRAYIPGGTWFFTVNLLDRQSQLLTERHSALMSAIRRTKRRFPFRIEALVVLPDHLHAIWTLPDGDSDFSVRWRRIKAQFSQAIPRDEWRDPVRRDRGERGIWQRRFWEHVIRDEADFAHHLAYCYTNPVRHGLVDTIADWSFSTFHRDVRAGLSYPETVSLDDTSRCYGEPIRTERSAP
jgi:putative transposase